MVKNPSPVDCGSHLFFSLSSRVNQFLCCSREVFFFLALLPLPRNFGDRDPCSIISLQRASAIDEIPVLVFEPEPSQIPRHSNRSLLSFITYHTNHPPIHQECSLLKSSYVSTSCLGFSLPQHDFPISSSTPKFLGFPLRCRAHPRLFHPPQQEPAPRYQMVGRSQHATPAPTQTAPGPRGCRAARRAPGHCFFYNFRQEAEEDPGSRRRGHCCEDEAEEAAGAGQSRREGGVGEGRCCAQGFRVSWEAFLALFFSHEIFYFPF